MNSQPGQVDLTFFTSHNADGCDADDVGEIHVDGAVLSWKGQEGPAAVLLHADLEHIPVRGRVEGHTSPPPSSTPRQMLRRHLTKTQGFIIFPKTVCRFNTMSTKRR